ncbi:unnamed protein product [Rotaria sordida]|uniref:Uncharacterized protein n=1 Tax=Rotaria sordida TaxID=392033 RepID=A0A818ICV4_9BILA|nr:unnamed protein product [Rotaria sordida]CAF3523475.1 unnamed protein product [Rotaria sordida]
MSRSRSSDYYHSGREHSPDDRIDQLNIRYRTCHSYVSPEQIDNENDDTCACKRPQDKHKFQQSIENSRWTMIYNTREEINAAYGRLQKGAKFVRLALDTPEEKTEKILRDAWDLPTPSFIISIIGGAKYFKISDRLETNFINGIIDIIQKSDAWLITNGYATGIVHLVGQAILKFKLSNVKKNSIIAIGICKWGSIRDVEEITRPKDEETEQITTDSSNINNKKRLKTRRSGEWDLETNHSYYLMLDDGTLRNYDTQDYRTRLVTHMARINSEHDFFVPVVTIVVEGGIDTVKNIYYDLKSNIPVVIIDGSGRAADFFARWLLWTKDLDKNVKYRDIVCEIEELSIEDYETECETMRPQNTDSNKRSKSNVNMNDHTECHINSKSKKLVQIFDNYKERIKKDIEETFFKNKKSKKKDSNKENADTVLDQVMYCLQPAVRSHLTVFNLNSNTDLSETIFRSICRSRQKLTQIKEQNSNDRFGTSRRTLPKLNTRQEIIDNRMARSKIMEKDQTIERTRLLDLAMKWDCIHVAKEFIFRNSLDSILSKDTYFIKALQENLPNFVYEFLKLGIDPVDVFFEKKQHSKGGSRYAKFIEELYDDVLKTSSDETHLKYFIEINKFDTDRNIKTIDSLNQALKNLIGDYMHELYFETPEDEKNDRIKWGLIKNSEESEQDKNKDTKNEQYVSDEAKKQKEYNYIMRDLFLWAILMNRIDMAKVFLSHMKYRICPALIATKILKQYHSKAHYGDLKKGYEKAATYFEQYAIDCLDKCDDNDVDKACEIVIQQNELYGYVTCLQVASDAQDKSFLSEPTCVQAMNNIWYDKLSPEQTSIRHRWGLLSGIVSLGLLAPFFVTYRESKEKRKTNGSTPHKFRAHGINYGEPTLLEYPRIPKPLTESVVIRYERKLQKFHRSLPMKYCYHLITYIFFLLLFSYFLLFNFSPPKPQSPSIHWTEILTIILVSCILIEEIRYFLAQDNLTFPGKVKSYFRNSFKPMTILALTLFYIGLILRFAHADSEDEFVAARVVMAIDVEIWWLRCLSFIIVIPFLGPHLVAIGQMLKDLIFFTCIIAIVMIGYGVASRSMVYYPVVNKFTTETDGFINTTFDGRLVFRQILYPVYYFLYGDFGDELTNLDSNPDAGWSIATHVLLAIHMIFVNILLANLLIAMFSKRFEKVYEDTRNIWHSQQYLFTREYFTRSPFLPPISLIYDIYYLIRMFVFFIRRKCFDKSADPEAPAFKIIPKKKDIIKEWHDFEDAFTSDYAHGEVKALITASMKSKSGSDSDNKKKKDDMVKHDNDLNKANDNLKQVQTDLSKLNTIVEEMNKRLEDEITPISSSESK